MCPGGVESQPGAARLGCTPKTTAGNEQPLQKDFSLDQKSGALVLAQEPHPD